MKYHYHAYGEELVKQWRWNLFASFRYMRFLRKKGAHARLRMQRDSFHVYMK